MLAADGLIICAAVLIIVSTLCNQAETDYGMDVSANAFRLWDILIISDIMLLMSLESLSCSRVSSLTNLISHRYRNRGGRVCFSTQL